MSLSLSKKIGILALTGAVAIGGAATVASAAGARRPSLSTTSAVSASSPTRRHPGRPASLFARADHGTLEVRMNGTWTTVTFDRGRVTNASATSVTLARPDGQSATLTITGTTKFRGVHNAGELQTGRPALVLSDSGANALIIVQCRVPASS